MENVKGEQIPQLELDFIIDALNFYWNDAYQQLQRNDLGDIERKNYEYQLAKSKELMTKFLK